MGLKKGSSKGKAIKVIQQKTKEFLADRKNANNVVDIIAFFESEDKEQILACIRSLHKIFISLLNQGEMFLEKPPTEEVDKSDLSAECKYRLWLRERYSDCRSCLLTLLTHDENTIQELALCTLMKMVAAEGQNPLREISDKQLKFPSIFFELVIINLLQDDHQMAPLISKFQEYLEYDDVRYFSMKFVLKNLKARSPADMTDTYLHNVFSLLEQLSFPPAPEGDTLTKFLSKPPASEAKLKMNTYKEQKKLFTTLWLTFLRLKLPVSLYKKVLLLLHEKVIPFLTSPLLLADFLTESYNIGGAISLLALNGLFILVYNYNLDYADFFTKLYALFEPSVYHVKYRARFFFLADLFLTSTHLPAYVVAAFVKRLARIALAAPPDGLTVTIPFILNLLTRHPSCKELLHHPDGPSDVTSDPYNMDEPDPSKCNAMASSLWELKTLQSHYHHSLSSEAKKIDHPLKDMEIDISGMLETSTQQLFDAEVKKKIKHVAKTFEAPTGIFGNKEDRFKDLWLLE